MSKEQITEKETIRNILYKFFKNEKTIYFHSSDHHKQIEGDTYLRYNMNEKVEIWFGGNNGEVCLVCTNNVTTLEKLLSSIIFG